MLDLQQEICVAFRFSARRLRHDYRVAAALLVVGPVPDVKPTVRPAAGCRAQGDAIRSSKGFATTRREANARNCAMPSKYRAGPRILPQSRWDIHTGEYAGDRVCVPNGLKSLSKRSSQLAMA